MCLFWNDGLNKKEFDTYGVGIKNQLNYFDGEKTEYWVSKKDWKAYRDGLQKLIRNSKWIATLPWEAERFLEDQLARFTKEFPPNLKSLSNEELLALQQKVAKEVGWTNSRTWIIYLSNDIIAEAVREELLKRISDQKRVAEYVLSFSTPLEMNNAMHEHVELLALASERKRLSEKEFERRLRRHAKKFEYIPMFGFDHTPYTLAHFKSELRSLSDPETELRGLRREMTGRKEKFAKELDALHLREDEELYALIQLLKHTVFVRDYRDTLRQQMYLLDRYMYEEIGKRIGGLTAEEVTNLTNEEICDGLNNRRTEKMYATAKARMQGFLVIQHEGEISVYTGKEAEEKARIELPKAAVENATELRGVVGSRGKAVGPARIILTNKDLGKIKEGDIMVTVVTRQDYVPAMRKCAAIVNDEGGVTNHAAIISREFKIPCIVGTKIGVKIFRDGDILEVDALSGIVRKVTRQ